MPKVSEAHLDARRSQILDAACECFSRKGFHATTIADIREESGLSTGAIYGHFENKEAIVRAAADEARGRLEARVAEATAEATAREGLRSLLEVMAVCADGEGDDTLRSARLEVGLWAGALSLPYLRDVIGQWYELVIPALTELVRRTREEEDRSQDPPAEATARVVVAALQGGQLQRAMGAGGRIGVTRVLLAWL